MPKYTVDTLLGYQPRLIVFDPDLPDSAELPCTLMFVSPDVDDDGDPMHQVKIPMLPQHRKAIAAALLAAPSQVDRELEDALEATPEDRPPRGDTTMRRCQKCRDWVSADGEVPVGCSLADSASDAELHAAAEMGCPEAIRALS